jgi:MFS family permease
LSVDQNGSDDGMSTTRTMQAMPQTAASGGADRDSRYKWIALSNTTLGVLMVTINASILLIALPDIFRGIDLDPLLPGNTGYLLWLIMGFLVVTAVLVVSFGRVGDMYGRVRMYNLGFAVFTVFSILLSVTWMHGSAGAMWLIIMRVLQGIGGALLFANSSAILTDAFPEKERGLALGINSVAAIAGSFLGLLIGGLLAPISWRMVFLVSVPFGIFGTVWAYLKLRDSGERRRERIDWWGNITFAVGLIAVLAGITYGIQPYGGHTMGWTSPWVLTAIFGGLAVLVAFVVIETRVAAPMFQLSLFRTRAFSAGNAASLLAALGRGGLQFLLIIWLQGIWLPLHGYSFESTPLWAGIAMIPLTVGFLAAAPISGYLSDHFGARPFATGGMLVAAVSFALLLVLPVNFNYWAFAAILLLNGIGMGLFSSPNRAGIMNSLPARARGVGGGMAATFQNSAQVLSIGIFFSLIILGLSSTLGGALFNGLTSAGIAPDAATRAASLPPVATLFASLLGYNPIQELLGPAAANVPPDTLQYVTGRSFFPDLIADSFANGLHIAFGFAVIACLVAAAASALRGGVFHYSEPALAAAGGLPATDDSAAAPAVAPEADPQPVAAGSPTTAFQTVDGSSNGAGHALRPAATTEPVVSHRPAPEPQPEPEFVPDPTPAAVGRITVAGRAAAAGTVTVLDLHGAEIAHGRTDDDGRFHIPLDETHGAADVVVVARGAGFAPVAASMRVGANGHGNGQSNGHSNGNGHKNGHATGGIDLDAVPTTGVVDGRIAVSTGGSAAGAAVLLLSAGAVVARTTTDTDGAFRFGDVVSGEYVLSAHLPGGQPRSTLVMLPASGHVEI